MRVFLPVLVAVGAWAQLADTSYDESKAGAIRLPDPLVLNEGERVKEVPASSTNASGSRCSADIT